MQSQLVFNLISSTGTQRGTCYLKQREAWAKDWCMHYNPKKCCITSLSRTTTSSSFFLWITPSYIPFQVPHTEVSRSPTPFSGANTVAALERWLNAGIIQDSSVGNTILHPVPSTPYRGVSFSNTLKWSQYSSSIRKVAKCMRYTGFLVGTFAKEQHPASGMPTWLSSTPLWRMK